MSPHEFIWGAATSSHQIEGNNIHNDWWAWEAEGKIQGGVRSGLATDHWNRFREDLRLAADLGLNSYRFSIEWSRIEPKEGRWDAAAIEWYRELILECERLKLLPMVTLHHFTSPQWFAEKGGFAAHDAPAYFLRYVKKVAETLGSRIPLWCTINEPLVLAVGGYLGGFMPPAKFSAQDASQALVNLLESHVRAYDLLHGALNGVGSVKREGPWRLYPLAVGFAHNMLDFVPDRAWHPAERLLRRVLDRFYNRAWLDAISGRKQNFGVPWILPTPAEVEIAKRRRTADFVGINYYTKAYVQWKPRDGAREHPPGLPIGVAFARKKELQSDVGWAIYPAGFRNVISLASSYGLPIYITENGIADREDRLRPDYLRAHIQEVQAASKSGIDIRGYYHWSLLDNFEWVKGFGPRFGLYQMNYETMERVPTESCDVYRSMIQEIRR